MSSPVIASGPLALLTYWAPEFGAQLVGVFPNALHLQVTAPLPDGTKPSYAITAKLVGNGIVTAQETVPCELPASCPERHINRNGTFCLGWDEVDRIEVTDRDAAWRWWATLVGFLKLQARAKRLRRWPSRKVWAHGDAARHQQTAMQAAAVLGAPFIDDVEEGRLRIVQLPGKGNEPVLRVLRDGRRLYEVWLKPRRVVNLRGPCVCSAGQGTRPAVLKTCGKRKHAEAAAGLAVALQQWVAVERAFWNSLKNQKCCGTMDDCPLAAAA